MKTLIISGILLVFFTVNIFAQNEYSFEDSLAIRVSAKTVEQVHNLLVQDLKTDKQKLRAFYTWITHNINYDVSESRKSSADISKQHPDKVLQRKLAVCHGYSVLFSALCDLSDIKCYLVSGYTRYDNKFTDMGHTWNVVFVDDNWLPIDATWGAGGVDNRSKYVKQFDDYYFLTNPVDFLNSHYALDPAFQLVEYPAVLNDYKKGNWVYNSRNKKTVYHYSDTIANWENLDSIQRRVRSAARMIKLNPTEIKAKREYNYAMIEYASSELNKGNAILNNLYPNESSDRNSKDKSIAINAVDINVQLNTALKNLRSADTIFDTIKPLDQAERSTIQMAKNVIKQNIRFIESKKDN